MKNRLVNTLKQYPSLESFFRKSYAILPGSYRLGKDFWKWYALFEDMESWPLGRLQEYQLYQLKQLLERIKSVNRFYGNLLHGIDINQIHTLSDFSSIFPAISRLEFSANLDAITSHGLHDRYITSSTSGTTGTALQFRHARLDDQREWAAICHQWKRVGYDPVKSIRAEFRALTAHNQLIQKFPDKNMIRCSILNINAHDLKHFADSITRYGVDFYHGYPSALYLLAKEVNTSGVSFPQPKGVLLASEQVYPWQIDEIRAAFPEAKIMAHYGCAERVVLAAWCEHQNSYHVLPQYSIVEVDENTKEIIGTNLYNSINPFIRYRMTDTVTSFQKSICEQCRRPYVPILQLSGRSEDFLFSPEKGWIAPAIITYPLKNLRAIKELRFLQAKDTDITVEFTTHNGSGIGINDEVASIELGLRELLGSSLNIRFEHVPGIARTATGKFKWIVSDYWNSTKQNHSL